MNLALMHGNDDAPEPAEPAESYKLVRTVNGRIVSATLNDPEMKQKLEAKLRVLREDPAALKRHYVTHGYINANGKLTKRYGG